MSTFREMLRGTEETLDESEIKSIASVISYLKSLTSSEKIDVEQTNQCIKVLENVSATMNSLYSVKKKKH